MDPNRVPPSEILIVCGVLLGMAFIIGRNFSSETPSPAPPEDQFAKRLDAELEDVRKEAQADLRDSQNQIQTLTLEIQSREVRRKLEQQAAESLAADLRRQLGDAKAKWQSEVESRQALEELIRELNQRLKTLAEEQEQLKRQLEAEILELQTSLRLQSESQSRTSPRVPLRTLGSTPPSSLAREARVREWRQRFERSQAARDIINADLEKQRAADLMWVAGRMEEGGYIEWPSLLEEPEFVTYRTQAEFAVRDHDLKRLSIAASGALVLLERRAKDYGHSIVQYRAAKRFLNALMSFDRQVR